MANNFFFDALNSDDDDSSNEGLSKEETELYSIFSEKPATLDEFLADEKYLGSTMAGATLSPIQRDFVDHFVQILKLDTYRLMAEVWGDAWTPLRRVNNLAVAWGKGSGKDFCVQIGFAYITHQLLCLKSPQSYYGLPNHTYIHMMNVAISSTQASEVFFKPMKDLFVESPWFKDKFATGELPPERSGVMRMKKRIDLISGHSEASSLEGKNLIAAVADEIAGFATKADASSTGRAPTKTAEGIMQMLKSSALTRFAGYYKVVQISFARRFGDAIMTALREAKENEEEYGEDSTYYSCGPYSTWEVNPKFKQRFKFVEIPQSKQLVPNDPEILNDYRKDPVFARGYYECKPEKSSNPYFKDKEAIKNSFSREINKEPLEIEYYYGVDRVERETYPSWQVRFTLNDLVPREGACYAIHADMAKNGDIAGIAMSHVKEFKEVITTTFDGGQNEERRPVVKVDFATAFTHDMSAEDPDGNSIPREIQMRWYRKLVLWLTDKGFNIQYVTMDGWQSLDSLQTLEAKGYNTKKVSTDTNNAVWQTVRDVMYDGRLDAYYNKHVISEFESLTQLSNGKVDHPADFSKDIADALGCSVSGAVEMGGEEEDENAGSFFVTKHSDNIGNPFVSDLYNSNYGLGPMDTNIDPGSSWQW